MSEFFTWQVLGSYAGAVLAVTLFTQLLKGVWFLKRIPPRLVSYVLALGILLLAGIFTGGLSFSGAALSFVNAAVVSLAANGAFDMAKEAKDTKNNGMAAAQKRCGFFPFFRCLLLLY